MKRIKYSNGSEVTVHTDAEGLTASTRLGTFSVTPRGGQATIGTNNIRATVAKDLQNLVAQDKKGRQWSATKTPEGTSVGVHGKKGGLNVSKDNVNIRAGDLNVAHGSRGTGVRYKNISAHRASGGEGYSLTAHKNIQGMNTKFEVGEDPYRGRYGQVNLNISTGRRNK